MPIVVEKYARDSAVHDCDYCCDYVVSKASTSSQSWLQVMLNMKIQCDINPLSRKQPSTIDLKQSFSAMFSKQFTFSDRYRKYYNR